MPVPGATPPAFPSSCASIPWVTDIGGRAAPWNPTWSASAGRAWQLQRTTHRLEQRVHVVPRHDADVGQPEILEQLAGLGEVHDGLAEPATPFEGGLADDRDALDRAIVGALALAPGVRQLDLGEVLADRPDRRADGHLVVVDDDQHLCLAVPDVVQRLERQAAHQRRVAHDDRDALKAVAEIARLREALSDGQAGARMSTIEHIVRRFTATREPTDTIELAKRREPLEPAGQQLVRVRLVAGIPHDAIAGRFEQPVECDRELHDTQRRAQMAAGRGDGLDDGLADLEGQLRQLDLVHPTQIGR